MRPPNVQALAHAHGTWQTTRWVFNPPGPRRDGTSPRGTGGPTGVRRARARPPAPPQIGGAAAPRGRGRGARARAAGALASPAVSPSTSGRGRSRPTRTCWRPSSPACVRVRVQVSGMHWAPAPSGTSRWWCDQLRVQGQGGSPAPPTPPRLGTAGRRRSQAVARKSEWPRTASATWGTRPPHMSEAGSQQPEPKVVRVGGQPTLMLLQGGSARLRRFPEERGGQGWPGGAEEGGGGKGRGGATQTGTLRDCDPIGVEQIRTWAGLVQLDKINSGFDESWTCFDRIRGDLGKIRCGFDQIWSVVSADFGWPRSDVGDLGKC